MDWFTWMSEGVGAWAKKVLAALGIGWLSFEGFQAALDGVINSVSGNWAGLAGDVGQFLALTGIGEAFGIMLGGISGMIVLLAFKRLGAVQA